MGIFFEENAGRFHLDAGNSSYVFQVNRSGHLEHLYHGPKIRDCDLAEETRYYNRAFSPYEPEGSNPASLNDRRLEYSTRGMGVFRTPTYSVKTPEGCDSVNPRYVSHKIYSGKKGLPGLPALFCKDNAEADSLEITLRDEISGLEFILFYTVFRDLDVLARSSKIINNGSDKAVIEKIASCTLDFDSTPLDLIDFHGSWARERWFERNKLPHGIHKISSTRGSSGHQLNPFVMLAEEDADENHGRVMGAALLYSGNFAAEIEKDQTSTTRLQFGIDPEIFGWELLPGAEFQSPECALVFSDGGFGKMSRTFHDLFRNHLIRSPWLNRERPILINNWEATYFGFDTGKLLQIAGNAAKLGINLFVLDDGWFGKRDDDHSGLGDWEVNEKKLPGGLKHLSSEINKLGMKFGLWFEPEMVNPDSNLFRAHPDWCFRLPERKPFESRNQLVLDFSRPEIVNHIFLMICKILDDANIEYIKWDMNRHLTDVHSAALPPERQKEVYHRYVLGVYRLHEMLLERYPNLLIEGCSGGGGRFDAGMLYYVPQIWCSDDSDAMERLKIQYGTSFAYPAMTMGAHVSACPNHQVGRVTPFHTRGCVALAGTFGYELDIGTLTEDELRQVREQTALYHEINPLVCHGDLYRLSSPFRDPVTAWMNVAKDRSEFVLTYVVREAIPHAPDRFLRLAGLDPRATYADESGKEFGGDVLMNRGIWLESLNFQDGTAVLRHFKRR